MYVAIRVGGVEVGLSARGEKKIRVKENVRRLENMNQWDKYRTAEERYWDETYEKHLDGDCDGDCALCREEDEANHASDIGAPGSRYLGEGLSPRMAFKRAKGER